MGERTDDARASAESLAFGVLGPFTVRRAGKRVVLPSGQTPQLLAVLVLNQGSLVSHELLSEVLWDEDPPASARKLIQVRLSQLRRLLGEGAELVGGRQGYRLEIPSAEVDLHEFRRLVADAELVPPEAAEPLLHNALRLWRGVALDELSGTVRGARIVAGLEEERLAAVSAHAEAALATGRCPGLVTDLASIVAEYPLRERLRAHLMRALHRAGRQAEALAAFEEGRVLLAEELGLDPGKELREAHAEILEGDSALAHPEVARPATAGAVPSVPRQLPGAPAHFVGRQAESAALISAATGAGDGPALVAVHGQGGQGKSALVLHVAQQLADSFPDGQLYVDLLGSTPGASPLAAEDVLRRFLRSFGVPAHAVPQDPTESSAMFRSAIAGKKVLVVLDNAVDSAQVVPLLPAGPGTAVLVTSRRILATLDSLSVALEPLATADAVALFASHLDRALTQRERGAAKRVAEVCGHLPLAVRIAAARLRGRPDWTVTHLLDRLADQRRRLDELDFDNLAVRSSMELSYRDLDDGAARAFRLLGLLPLPYVSLPVAAALLGHEPDTADTLLEPLVSARLIEVAAPGRYRLHDLVRLFALERAERHESKAERDTAVSRVLDHYQVRLNEAHTRLRPHNRSAEDGEAPPDHDDSPGIADYVRWISDEIDNLVAAARMAAGVAELAPRALSIAHQLRLYLWAQEMRADAVEIAHLAGTAAERVGTDEALDLALDVQALINQHLGRLGEAHALYTRLLDVRRRLGDISGQGRTLGNLGILLRHMGRLDEALHRLGEAGELLDEHGPAEAKPLVLACLADVHLQADRPEEGLRHAERSLALCAETDPTCAVYALVSIGQAHSQLGDLPSALTALSESITLCRTLHLPHDEWEALLCRSEVHVRAGEPDAAIADAERVLTLLSNHGDYYAQGAAHRQFARAFQLKGDELVAVEHASYAESLFASPGVRRNPLLERLLARERADTGESLV
ncbi:hypothetical protein BAY61_18960 [Prauserella marina]|uniref:DNA-binding transcriptional activator of the SARP family n=1 Tax=Prauserella marina TaxID=530584 RepID=A0A222VS09_9PSEU|nr:BTAD domain-containing putative transcriptional regulator [Prauserella marina]ASR36735.1 hypothetical protein BAY61_18960 [Prauserella marina]PWV80382.1 DNA-binding SARP family transcriptional activator [Prauserella marina]SDD53116.1 DNA-binding transcriptional activator of the SARP family [Prauserella marina]